MLGGCDSEDNEVLCGHKHSCQFKKLLLKTNKGMERNEPKWQKTYYFP